MSTHVRISSLLVAEVADAVMSKLRERTSPDRQFIESLAADITTRFLQQDGSRRVRAEGLDSRRLTRVLDHIEANLEDQLTIDTLASVACLSRYHFSRAFGKAMGQSPHRYVSSRRVERAKILLSKSDQPLVDIALELGFSSQANFTRAFSKATGQAPGHFRRQKVAGRPLSLLLGPVQESREPSNAASGERHDKD